jgi:hypothetical protein
MAGGRRINAPAPSEGSKKAQGQARKAEAAAAKQAGKQKEVDDAESREWEKGTKDTSKKYG